MPLHQEATDKKYGKKQVVSLSDPDFTGTEWDLLRAGAHDDSEVPRSTSQNDVISKVDKVAADLKSKLTSEADDLQLISGITKFVN